MRAKHALGVCEQALDLLLGQDAPILRPRLRPLAALELGEGVVLDVATAAGEAQELALRRLDRAQGGCLRPALAQGLREGDDVVGGDASKLALAPGGKDVLAERPAVVLERARGAFARGDLGGEAGEELLDRARDEHPLLPRARPAAEATLARRSASSSTASRFVRAASVRMHQRPSIVSPATKRPSPRR